MWTQNFNFKLNVYTNQRACLILLVRTGVKRAVRSGSEPSNQNSAQNLQYRSFDLTAIIQWSLESMWSVTSVSAVNTSVHI